MTTTSTPPTTTTAADPGSVTSPETNLWAALAGFLAAAAAVSSAELLAGASRKAPSVVIGMFDVLVDYSPSGVVAWSRETFGTNQKAVTTTGIVIVTLLLGALFGILGARVRRVGVAGFVAFGVVGAWAAARSPLHDAWLGWLAGAIAVAVGVGVLGFLLARLPFTASDAPFPQRLTSSRDRRIFLAGASAAAFWGLFAGGLGRSLRGNQSVEASRDDVAARLAEQTTVGPNGVSTTISDAARFDDTVEGISSLVTANDSFYRIDTAGRVPLVDVDDWSLTIKGMVDEEVTLTFDDILAMDLIEETITMSCVSNEVGGSLVGNAVWRGVPLAALLDRAGVQPGATQIVGRSIDDWTAGFPTEIAYDGRPAMLAITMNGEPLPANHGFPARLVVPGLYGYVSATKWITEIELTTWDDFDGYWINRGWSKEGPIKTQSRIDVPNRRTALTTGPTPIAGVAWAGLRSVDKVEVQVDNGAWIEATLSEELSDSSWRQWLVTWDATPGRHTLSVRATDGEGVTQTPERVPVAPDGATGHHTITVEVATA